MTESNEPAAGYPFPTDFTNGSGLCQINDKFLNNISHFILGLDIQIKDDITDPFLDRSSDHPERWIIYIPSGSGGGLPSNAQKSKYMTVSLSADNPTDSDDPKLWQVDWLRWV